MDTSDFVQGIQGDLGHRKQELSGIWLMVQEAGPDSRRLSFLSRSAVMLAYAHWEGCVKSGGKRYVKYINSCQVPVIKLKRSLQAILLTSQFKRGADSTRIRVLGELLEEMDRCRTAVFATNPEKCIDVESNLTSKVFRDLVLGLGLDYLDLYGMRAAFIDQTIVWARNQVAHGELVPFDDTDVETRIKGVLRLLDTFSNQLIDAVHQKSFLAE